MITLDAGRRTLSGRGLPTLILTDAQVAMIKAMVVNMPTATHEQLYNAIPGTQGTKDVVSAMRGYYMRDLRQTLRAGEWPNIIRTSKGTGYGLLVPVEIRELPPAATDPLAEQLRAMIGSVCLAANRLALLV